MIVAGITLWKFLSQRAQSVSVPPNGVVAGVSTEVKQVNRAPTLSVQLALPTLLPTSTTQATPAPISSSSPSPNSPTSAPTQTQPVVIGFQNGDFSEGTRYWEKRGTITVLELTAADRLEDFEGIGHFARLASETSLQWLGSHELKQVFHAPPEHRALEFWYRIHSQETEPGFDSPCFVVFVNNQAVAWFSASDAKDVWQRFAVPLPQYSDQVVSIRFTVGQTGDQALATWVDLTNIYTQPELPFRSVAAPLAADSQLRLSFTDAAHIGLSMDAETPIAPLKFTQKLSNELLFPEIAFQQSLQQLAWTPDGTRFEPEITSPDFFGTQASLYAAAPENPWNLPVQLNQLKDRNLTLPIKLWLVVKTALHEVLQLVTVVY